MRRYDTRSIEMIPHRVNSSDDDDRVEGRFQRSIGEMAWSKDCFMIRHELQSSPPRKNSLLNNTIRP
jgi:hypothetical protein